MNKKYFIIFLFSLSNIISFSQERVLYKEIDSTKLFIEVYTPTKMDKSKKHAAIVFFFGGGWKKGNTKQFEPHVKYFSKRGAVCFLVDYRVTQRHQSTPFESLKDAKSAIRFIRENASEYQIDVNKIVASGGSAGGHLAAATAMIEKYNEKTDNRIISSKPNALILFNPALDNGPGGVGYERVKNDYQNFSPFHNITSSTPPTLILTGTNDNLIPVDMIKKYQQKMLDANNRCEVKFYEGRKHSFFNYRKFENYKSTVKEANEFLISLNYLSKNPEVAIE